MIEILFLGTAASMPSRHKSLPCVAARHGSDVLLFDCGEGTQRQLMISPLSFMKVKAIFLTHLHGDHIIGVPGLLQTMGLSGRKDPIFIYGPSGTGNSVRMLMGSCEGELQYPVEVIEADPGLVFEGRGYSVSAVESDHGTASLAYVMEENAVPGRINRSKAESLGLEPKDLALIKKGISVKGVDPGEVTGPARRGVKIVITGDTRPHDRIREAAAGADMLIHEATFMNDSAELADAHMHSTALQAAEIARGSDAGMLVLTHISNRYEDLSLPEEEARSVFPNTVAARDMDMYQVSISGIRSV
ncbi:MAG: ribonuclease Z [Thermoplasmatales archaeon]|jgi:ribonuclease Z|nr:ribonuclease Z [Thermoplasmatales archaeon]